MGLNITEHSGKLKGMRSISTAVTENKTCHRRSKIPGSICSRCYARRFEEFRASLRRCLEENTILLRRTLRNRDIPTIDDAYFRIESFGECGSVTQAKNYVRIAQYNPKTRFAVWTKNLGFYKKAFDALGKPKNLVLVYSSPMIGEVGIIPDQFRKIVDHRFTVMPKGTRATKINCGGRKCLSCLRCYRKNTAFDVFEIEK